MLRRVVGGRWSQRPRLHRWRRRVAWAATARTSTLTASLARPSLPASLHPCLTTDCPSRPVTLRWGIEMSDRWLDEMHQVSLTALLYQAALGIIVILLVLGSFMILLLYYYGIGAFCPIVSILLGEGCGPVQGTRALSIPDTWFCMCLHTCCMFSVHPEDLLATACQSPNISQPSC